MVVERSGHFAVDRRTNRSQLLYSSVLIFAMSSPMKKRGQLSSEVTDGRVPLLKIRDLNPDLTG